MDKIEYGRFRQVATEAALRAGSIQRGRFMEDTGSGRMDNRDLTGVTDRDSNELIIRYITKTFPDHSIISEEDEYRPGSAEYEWTVDPLDGSVNYYMGIPYYCISIACHRISDTGSDPVLGIVYAPHTGEFFAGGMCEPASLNGVSVTSSRWRSLQNGIIGLSLGSCSDAFVSVSRYLPRFFEHAGKVRSLGSTALDLCRVATGGLCGLYQYGVKQWDFSAGAVILEASGCRFHARPVNAWSWEILAGNTHCYEELEEIVEWKQSALL